MWIRWIGRLQTVIYQHGKDDVGGAARRGRVHLFTVPESVHMSNLAGGYLEMVKARNSARGHLMAWHDKQDMQEHFKELSILKG